MEREWSLSDCQSLFLSADIQKMLVQFVHSVKEKYPDTYDSVKTSMTPEMASKLDHCLTIDINSIPATNGYEKGCC